MFGVLTGGHGFKALMVVPGVATVSIAGLFMIERGAQNLGDKIYDYITGSHFGEDETYVSGIFVTEYTIEGFQFGKEIKIDIESLP